MFIAALLATAAWGPPHPFCTISDPAVKESSGIAVSRTTPGVFYTHNDSGDSPRFFRFDRTGQVTGVFTLGGSAAAVDWEDIASVSTTFQKYLYLADVGDNARARVNIKIYRVVEPTGSGRTLTQFDTYTLNYPGAKQDCEAVMVDPATLDIYLVSKARDGFTRLFRVPSPPSSGTYTLESLGTIDINTGGIGGNLVTGADATHDRVILRTYTGAVEFQVTGAFKDFANGPRHSVKLAKEGQGEAICYSLNAQAILTTSEGTPCPVSIVYRQSEY
ncbi:MAG: hypothetical protein KF884_12805 [Fimbriimonadaceae bacterium]|nr:hypothetical protein [Fimbriimonadaceae bacterium]QYK58421.1 MAG: hypothetical protein KF884_12805 [Fimbriimonadaceae bacterium]